MEELDWQILEDLKQTHNLSKTAMNLMLSQPAISKRVQQIEARFNCSLGVRTKKGLVLSPEGTVLCDWAERLIKATMAAEYDVARARTDKTGVLRIGASNTFTKYLLPDILVAFKKLYPNIEVKVVTAWSRDLVHMLERKEIWMAFIRGEYSGIGERDELFEETMFAAACEYFEYEDLPKMQQVAYRNDEMLEFKLNHWWFNNYRERPNIGMSVLNVDACRVMVQKGLGYSFLSELIIKQECPELFRRPLLLEDGKELTRKTYIQYDTDLKENNIFDVFIQFVKNWDFKASVKL